MLEFRQIFLLTKFYIPLTIHPSDPQLLNNLYEVYEVPAMTFQIGERVVYPNHGVGVIENISSRNFGAQMERFYLLRLATNHLTEMDPFSHAGHVGLRKVTKSTETSRVLAFLSDGRIRLTADWKDRFKENSDKMRVGGLLAVAEVFKTLIIIQREKPLSFREKKMLDKARSLLICEVSIAKGINETASTDTLSRALLKSGLPMPEAM